MDGSAWSVDVVHLAVDVVHLAAVAHQRSGNIHHQLLVIRCIGVELHCDAPSKHVAIECFKLGVYKK